MVVLSPTIGMSGKWGTVDGEVAIKNWQIASHARDNRQTANTRTQGAVHRFSGNEDWNGSYSQDAPSPPNGVTGMPGSVVEFKGYAGPSDGIPDPLSVGPIYNAMCMIESIQVDWNWETNDPVTILTNIAGHGNSGSTGAPDGVLRLLNDVPYIDVSTGAFTITPMGAFVQIALDIAIPVYADVCTARASLTVNSNNTTFLNSFTGIYTGRRKGNVDWTLSLVMSQADPSINLPLVSPQSLSPGLAVNVRLPGLAGTFWELLHGRVRDQTNFVVDRDTGAIIAYTVNIDMTALTDVDLSIGQIDLPGAVTYWPT